MCAAHVLLAGPFAAGGGRQLGAPALRMPEERGVPAAAGLCPPLPGWLPLGTPPVSPAAAAASWRRIGEPCRHRGTASSDGAVRFTGAHADRDGSLCSS